MRLRILTLAAVLGLAFACTSTPTADDAKEAPAKKGKSKKGKKKGGKARLAIKAGAVGPFAIGKPTPRGVEGFALSTEERTEEAEGNTFTVTWAVAKKGDRTVVEAKLDGGNITEVFAVGPAAKTGKGVGPGTTVEAVKNAYPDAAFRYSYVSERFWVESAAIGANTQLILPASAFTGDRDALGKTDLDQLKPGDFAADGKVKSVRVF